MLRFILLGMFFVLILLLCLNFTLNKLRSWDGPGGSLSNDYTCLNHVECRAWLHNYEC